MDHANLISLCSQLKNIPIGNVYDACIQLGIQPHMIQNLKPLDLTHKICGPVFTVHFADQSHINPPLYQYNRDYLYENISTGSVLVIQSDSLKCSVMGEITARMCQHKQLQGTIINGCVRDSREILEHVKYPIFCRGETCVKSQNYLKVIAITQKIVIDGYDVNSGDIVIADRSATLFFQSTHLYNVLSRATKIMNDEDRVINSLNNISWT